MSHQFANLLKVVWSGKSSVFEPDDFKRVLGIKNKNLNNTKQHDANECILTIINNLSQELSRIEKKVPYQSLDQNQIK